MDVIIYVATVILIPRAPVIVSHKFRHYVGLGITYF